MNIREIRILVAEDNPADVYLLREAMSQQRDPVELVVVSDGEEALEFIDRTARHADAPIPDLFVLDLNLPKSDGSDILKRIREKPEYAGVPVVILTSSDSPRDRNVISNLGVESFLTKPSDLDEFLALGDKLLQFIRQTASEPSAAAK
ncbi:MAG TPA: response regulator [Bryobacteraceae bacterium]|nr:response regulator [Bryobacteraceae bacterium]